MIICNPLYKSAEADRLRLSYCGKCRSSSISWFCSRVSVGWWISAVLRLRSTFQSSPVFMSRYRHLKFLRTQGIGTRLYVRVEELRRQEIAQSKTKTPSYRKLRHVMRMQPTKMRPRGRLRVRRD